MSKNLRENFGVLSAIAELTALSEGNPLMRQVMLRLSVAYRELDERARAETAAPRSSATVIEFEGRAAPRCWRHAEIVGAAR